MAKKGLKRLVAIVMATTLLVLPALDSPNAWGAALHEYDGNFADFYPQHYTETKLYAVSKELFAVAATTACITALTAATGGVGAVATSAFWTHVATAAGKRVLKRGVTMGAEYLAEQYFPGSGAAVSMLVKYALAQQDAAFSELSGTSPETSGIVKNLARTVGHFKGLKGAAAERWAFTTLGLGDMKHGTQYAEKLYGVAQENVLDEKKWADMIDAVTGKKSPPLKGSQIAYSLGAVEIPTKNPEMLYSFELARSVMAYSDLRNNGGDAEKLALELQLIRAQALQDEQFSQDLRHVANCRVLLAILDYNSGKYEAAAQWLEKAEKSFSLRQNAFLDYLGSLIALSEGKLDKAESRIRRALRTEPEELTLYMTYARMCQKRRHYRKMTDVLEEAMRAVNNGEVRSQGQDRKDYSVVKPMILQLLGDAKRGSRYWRRAAQHYKEAAESFRENDLKAKCYTDAACCFVKLGNKTEADRNYQKALALVSDDMKEALAVYYQEGQK